MYGIVITTHPKNREWLDDLLINVDEWGFPVVIAENESDKTEYKGIKVFSQRKNSYEMWGLGVGVQMGWDEFIHLQDSVIIKKPSLFQLVFDPRYGGVNLPFLGHPTIFGCHLGKYVRSHLLEVGLEDYSSKFDSVNGEITFHSKLKKYPHRVLFPGIDDPDLLQKEEKHGRINAVVENYYFIKYKGTWKQELI